MDRADKDVVLEKLESVTNKVLDSVNLSENIILKDPI